MFRTLLVDDEKMTLVSTQRSFEWEKYGFKLSAQTTNPHEALQLLLKKHFDIAFVDIRMPELSGLDLIRLCRESAVNTEFVVISGYSDFEYMKEAIQLGACDYCLKPVQNKECHSLLLKLSQKLYEKRFACDGPFLEKLIENNDLEKILSMVDEDLETRSLMVVALTVPDVKIVFQKPSLERELCLLLSQTEALIFLPAEPTQVEGICQSYLSILECRMSFGVIADKSAKLGKLIQQVRTGLSQTTKEQALIRTNLKDSAVLDGLLEYVNVHFTEDLSLRHLAAEYNLNYTYCSELFKTSTGFNFSTYLSGLRMKLASELLLSSSKPIASISTLTGYNNYHHFTNVFKKTFGLTPTEFRQSRGKAEGKRHEENLLSIH